MSKTYVPGMGNSSAKLLILGDCPSYLDTQEQKPFTGPAGRELTTLLKDAGIHRDSCWLTNVSKYEVPPNVGTKKIPFHIRAKQAEINIDEQLADLQREITAIKPNCILAMGSAALWALSGKDKIGNYRGSIMFGMGRKFVPTYRPSDLLFNTKKPEFKGYWNRFVILFDMKRAIQQAQFPEYIIPNRTLQICNSIADLHEFRKRYKGHKRLSADIESGGTCIPICMGLSFNKNHGMTIPLWNRDGISSIPDRELAQIWIEVAEMLYEHEIVGQNFNYDRDKIRRLGFIIRFLASDTMLKAFAINPELPKRLAFNQSLYTEEPFYKDEGMYEGPLRDLFLGCARDACVTLEIDESMDKDLDELGMRPFYENFLMKLPELYLEIENTGFRIDPIKRDELIKKYVVWDERLRYELFKLVGAEVNVNSSQQVYSLLFDNLKLPKRDGTGEEELTSLLNLQSFTNQTHRRIVEIILEARRVRRTISSNILALPDYDGRIKTTCFPCLETGRSSTGQQEPPIRPSIEIIDEHGKKHNKCLGFPFQTMTKHGDIGQDIRSQYVPDEGFVFVQADSSQAEARVVFKLALDEQALKDIDEHDYHALTASWFFGGGERDYSKKVLGYESPIRFAGKTLRHAGHLGAGKRRAAISVNTDARKYKIPSLSGRAGEFLQITEAIAERALIIFHSKQPKIQRIFHAGVIEALKERRMLRAAIPYGVDSPVGPPRIFYERWGDELFRQAFSYIPQRTVSDNTKAAGLRIKSRFPECRIVMESHDSLLFMVRVEYIKDFSGIVKQEFERPINFTVCSLPRTRLIIPCEVEFGYNYQELSKFKDIPVLEKTELVVQPKTLREQFLAEPVLGQDSELTNLIYEKKYGSLP
jgi:uracil-DNA glycosylase family 4